MMGWDGNVNAVMFVRAWQFYFLRGYASVNAKNLGDFREFLGRKLLN